MDINDKLGRDRAEELMNTMRLLCGDKDGVEDIVKRTKMYQFLSGKTEHPAFTASNGIDKYPAWTSKHTRRPDGNKILHRITLDQYLGEGIIDKDEYDNLMGMLNSPDVENATMVEMLLEVKYRTLWQKNRARIKRKLKKLFSEQ